jgi:hypothetical protein
MESAPRADPPPRGVSCPPRHSASDAGGGLYLAPAHRENADVARSFHRESMTRALLLGLVLSVTVVTLVGRRNGASGMPPASRPAALDPEFRAALPELVAPLEEDEAVGVTAPPARRAVSSWYWTMAAFDVPRLRWSRVEEGGDFTGRWLVAPAGTRGWDGWRPSSCRRGWCLWVR